jgi:hypothetical protein
LFEAGADAEGRSWTYLAYGPFSDFLTYRLAERELPE